VLRKLRDNFAQSILIVPGDPEHAITGGQKAGQIRGMHASPATASDQRDRLPFPRQWRRNASLRVYRRFKKSSGEMMSMICPA
jgi:hypothetical protein